MGILIVWFGQVGWQRVGAVYCKQNTVISPWEEQHGTERCGISL